MLGVVAVLALCVCLCAGTVESLLIPLDHHGDIVLEKGTYDSLLYSDGASNTHSTTDSATAGNAIASGLR